MAGQDVQHPSLGQFAVRSGRGIAEEVDHVGLLGMQRIRSADADENPQPPAPRYCSTVAAAKPP